MTSKTDFVPVFGPNGAVMNAPSMTPEMRAKFTDGPGIPGLSSRFIAILFVIFLANGALGKDLRAFLLGSPWWHGVFTGGVAMLALGATWSFAKEIMRRWELSRRLERQLSMPAWARVALAASDIGMFTGLFGVGVMMVSDLYVKGFVAVVFLLSLFGVSAVAGWFMRWLADNRQWVWRRPA